MFDTKLGDELGRLAALRRYNILDTPPEASFDKLTALVQSILKTPICVITLIDAERQWFKSHAGIDGKETPRDISFCTHTIRQREPLAVPDALADPRFQASPLVLGAPFVRSYLGVPLETPDGYNVGALCAIDTVPRNFEPAEVEILKSFAALVVDELELRQAAHRDFLTGLMNRRSFAGEIDRQIALFQRHRRPGALIMFDIDHFKTINDRFGHPAGDKVLKEIALRASAVLRVGDCIGRVGGEEFAILLSETSAQQAAVFAERVRVALAMQPVMLEEAIGVTASFGIAPLASAMVDAAQWFSAADTALYQAKAEGRNRCVLASDLDFVETGSTA